MIAVLAELGLGLTIMGLKWAYHRWWEDHPKQKIDPQEVSIPRVDSGAVVPLIFGRCRVRAPILVWTDTPSRSTSAESNWSAGQIHYKMNMFFVVGIPFDQSTTRMYNLWIGDRLAGGGSWNVTAAASQATPTAIISEVTPSGTTSTDTGSVGGNVVYYDGSDTQDVGGSQAGAEMITSGVDVFQIPNYLGYLSVLLYRPSGTQWIIGSSPNVAAYSFEISSYRTGTDMPGAGAYAQIGLDSNPVNVIYDILVAEFGKLGIPSSYIDMTSFTYAAHVCYAENLGYSRSFESGQTADQMIQEILKYIDGAIDEEPTTGKVVITLVRADYDPNSIPHLTRANCSKLTNLVAGGWDNLPSSLQVIFSNRARDYNDDDVIAHNQGNAAQQGQTETVQEHFPGCTEPEVAKVVAARELGVKSKPVIKCRVYASRKFRNLVRGKPVKLTWNNPDIAGLIFRVADIDRGTLDDGLVAIDLISDYFLNWRGKAPVVGGLGIDYKDIPPVSVTWD